MEALMGDLLSNVDWTEIGWASWDTLVMVGMSLLFSVLIGLPVGVLLFLFGVGDVAETVGAGKERGYASGGVQPERWRWQVQHYGQSRGDVFGRRRADRAN
jgi:hypothetical protein